MVNANKELLIHVLFNLIKNALYFIRAAKKGEVTNLYGGGFKIQ